MTTTITPEQADILPAKEIDLDTLAELAKRLRREATAFDNDLGSDPEADAGTARLLREAAGAIDLVRRVDDHYFAVDYTGCIHEAPDRETAIKWAEDFARTANGGAIGSERPEVAAAIGSRAAVPSEQEPVTLDPKAREAARAIFIASWGYSPDDFLDKALTAYLAALPPSPAAAPSPPTLDGAGRDAVLEEIAEAEAALASVRKQALEALTAAHDFLDPISVVDSGVDVTIRALKETR